MKVLQTRCVGLAPDPQRLHDPRPQIVYEVTGEYETRPAPRTKRQMRSPLWARIVVPIALIWNAYVVVSALAGGWLF